MPNPNLIGSNTDRASHDEDMQCVLAHRPQMDAFWPAVQTGCTNREVVAM